jgi:hypothetical protein
MSKNKIVFVLVSYIFLSTLSSYAESSVPGSAASFKCEIGTLMQFEDASFCVHKAQPICSEGEFLLKSSSGSTLCYQSDRPELANAFNGKNPGYSCPNGQMVHTYDATLCVVLPISIGEVRETLF